MTYMWLETLHPIQSSSSHRPPQAKTRNGSFQPSCLFSSWFLTSKVLVFILLLRWTDKVASHKKKISWKGSLGSIPIRKQPVPLEQAFRLLMGLPEMVGAMPPASCKPCYADCHGRKPYVSPLWHRKCCRSRAPPSSGHHGHCPSESTVIYRIEWKAALIDAGSQIGEGCLLHLCLEGIHERLGSLRCLQSNSK